MYYSDMMIQITIICMIIGLVLCVLFGYFTAKIASKKGYSFGAFFALGFFLELIGLIIALVMPDKTIAPTPQIQTESADDLIKYKSLLDQGVISQEEFDAKKNLIMGANTQTLSNQNCSQNEARSIPDTKDNETSSLPSSNTNPKRDTKLQIALISLLVLAGIFAIWNYSQGFQSFMKAAERGYQFGFSPTFWICLIALLCSFVFIIVGMTSNKKNFAIVGMVCAFIGVIVHLFSSIQLMIVIGEPLIGNLLIACLPSLCLIIAGILLLFAAKKSTHQ